jgi:hypothetical protein
MTRTKFQPSTLSSHMRRARNIAADDNGLKQLSFQIRKLHKHETKMSKTTITKQIWFRFHVGGTCGTGILGIFYDLWTVDCRTAFAKWLR